MAVVIFPNGKHQGSGYYHRCNKAPARWGPKSLHFHSLVFSIQISKMIPIVIFHAAKIMQVFYITKIYTIFYQKKWMGWWRWKKWRGPDGINEIEKICGKERTGPDRQDRGNERDGRDRKYEIEEICKIDGTQAATPRRGPTAPRAETAVVQHILARTQKKGNDTSVGPNPAGLMRTFSSA